MNQPIIDKIRKLLAHEKSARAIGSIKEAQAFMAKVQELLDQHKLGMDEVDFDAREEGEPINAEHVGAADEAAGFRCGKKSLWQIHLAMAIADCNNCQVVLSVGNALYFVGRTSDRQICKMLFIYLIELAFHLNELAADQDRDSQKLQYAQSLKSWQDWDAAAFRHWMKDYRRSWYTGFKLAVCSRLYTSQNAMRTAMQANPAAIIHLKKDAELIKDFMHDVMKTKKSARSLAKSGRNEAGFARGKSQGNAINLSPNRFSNTSGRAGGCWENKPWMNW